ncbi:GNAT family N-acetyltransferase [Microbacterium resistens]
MIDHTLVDAPPIDPADVVALPEGARMYPLPLPAPGQGPTALVHAYAAVRNRSSWETSGRGDDQFTAEELLPLLDSNADMVRRQWCIEQDGALIGCAVLNIRQDGGADVAQWYLALLRDVWGRGIGSAAYAEIERVARADGVRELQLWAEHADVHADGARLESPSGFGSVPQDHATRFLSRHGHTIEMIDRVSMLTWDDATIPHLRGLLADAAAHAEGYRVVHWTLPTPPERRDGYAWMKSRMSTDAPSGDLASPEEAWDAERVVRHDERYAARGQSVLVTAAEHVGTGELCAFNELAIGIDRTATTHQEETLVLSSHRGHRLGMLVKCAGLLTWREIHPRSPSVVTYNAEENRPMLSINEAIGFTAIAAESAWKKVLT